MLRNTRQEEQSSDTGDFIFFRLKSLREARYLPGGGKKTVILSLRMSKDSLSSLSSCTQYRLFEDKLLLRQVYDSSMSPSFREVLINFIQLVQYGQVGRGTNLDIIETR